MKQIILSVLCCCFSTFLFAQTKTPAATTPVVANITVKGIIIDSAVNKPMGYVTVALQDEATKAPVKSTLAKDDGSFELKAPEGKTYQLVAVFIGYATKTIPVKLTGNTFNAGRILLSPSSKQLKEVTVTAVKPVMKQEVDRLSYDVTADPESKSITALDMIRKVPLLSVDGNDAIKLRGNDNYKILINGKESAMMAKNPSDVLKSMPAANIEKIEVITTPPAKYDAEGLAGIINIITKKNADQGYNVSINTGYNSVWGDRANVNLTLKQGKFGFSGYAGYNYRPLRTSSFENMTNFFKPGETTPFSSLSQNGTRGNSGKNLYGSGELSYEVDTLNLITGMFDFYNGKSNGKNYQVTRQDSADAVTQFYRLFNNGTGEFRGTDVGLNYQLGFKRNKEQLLTVSYKYNYNNNLQTSEANRASDFTGEGVPKDYRQYNNSGSKQHAFQLDYIQPSKILTVEAGGKATLRNNYSQFNTDVKSDADNEYHADPAQVNNFTYKQNIYGLYNSYAVKLDKWAFKAGMRLEHTTVNADFAVGQPPVNQNYDNFVPSASIQRSLKSSSLTLGFTQRIQRPGIYQLNPYTDISNPQYRNVGNPNLRAAVTNNFELGYSNFAKGSINLSTNYSFSNNTVQSLASVDTATKITTTRYANVGSNKNWGFDLNVNYPITSKLNVNINTELMFVWLKGYYNGSLFTNSGHQGHIFTYTSYKFDGGYRAGLNIGYDSRYVLLQGKDNYFFFSSISGTKTMFKEKVNLSLNVNNPFKKFNKLDFYTKGDGFETYTANNNFYRAINVSLSYKFGRLNSSIKKNQRGINNDDASGGGRN